MTSIKPNLPADIKPDEKAKTPVPGQPANAPDGDKSKADVK